MAGYCRTGIHYDTEHYILLTAVMDKFLDLRFAIGLFFILTGLLLLLYGCFHPASSVNLWSGGLFVIFGGIMIFLSFKVKQS